MQIKCFYDNRIICDRCILYENKPACALNELSYYIRNKMKECKNDDEMKIYKNLLNVVEHKSHSLR